MPIAEIKVIEGVFSDNEKQEMIQRVTDAMISVEGENLRDKTLVIIEEVKSNDWSVGGQSISTENVKEIREAELARK